MRKIDHENYQDNEDLHLFESIEPKSDPRLALLKLDYTNKF